MARPYRHPGESDETAADRFEQERDFPYDDDAPASWEPR